MANDDPDKHPEHAMYDWEREMDDIVAHTNPQARIVELTRESQDRRAREQDEAAERLRIQRENDPRYWKGQYERLLVKIEKDKEAAEYEKSQWRVILHLVLLAVGVSVVINIVKHVI